MYYDQIYIHCTKIAIYGIKIAIYEKLVMVLFVIIHLYFFEYIKNEEGIT